MKGIGEALLKFTSRKFIATLVVQVVALITLFGVAPLIADKIGQGIAAGAALIAMVLAQWRYVKTEGELDKQNIVTNPLPTLPESDVCP